MSKQLTGLGKGLDAIFQGAGTVMPTPNAKNIAIGEIALDKISANPLQPRTVFEEEALAELANSIKKLGVIQPITVRDNGDGTYMIISGERRFRASQMADLKAIPAYIRKVNDEELLQMALVENIQREDLNAMEIAITFDRLLKEFTMTQEQLATHVGKKRSTIANYVRLLTLPAEVQAALGRNLVTMGHARALVALSDVADQIYILEQIVEHGLSVRETEEIAARIGETKTAETPTKQRQPEGLKNLGRDLTSRLGMKVAVSKSAKGVGKVAITFRNDEELEAIMTILSTR